MPSGTIAPAHIHNIGIVYTAKSSGTHTERFQYTVHNIDTVHKALLYTIQVQNTTTQYKYRVLSIYGMYITVHESTFNSSGK